MNNTIPDWVLLEAAKRTMWGIYAHDIERLRVEYGYDRSTFGALCDMIAKHETKPVDPDEEAVKRVTNLACGRGADFPAYWNPENIARAVSQYKQEKANG